MSGFYWIASYPKSGNTWLRLLLASVMKGGGPVDINAINVANIIGQKRQEFDAITSLSSSDLTPDELRAMRPAALRAIAASQKAALYAKTHDARIQLTDGDWLVPPDVTLGAVYLVRDPRDVAISLSKHMGVDLDGAIALMADPTHTTGRSLRHLHYRLPEFRLGWSVNVASWLSAEPFEAHVVRYEDMRTDPAAALAGIMPVLGVTTTPEVIHAAIAATALDTLRGQEAAAGGFVEWRGKGGFFGRGRVGGWRDHLTATQVARIEADHGPLMRLLGYLV